MINVMENKVIGPLLLQAEEKGRTEGRSEGMQSVLADQLAEKFGPLPVWAISRIESASTTELQHWARRVLRAESLEDAFG